MAKEKMMCPFSKQMCRECPQFRGKHYYLCYCSTYRGHLEGVVEKKEKKSWSSGPDITFEVPQFSSLSPTWLELNEFTERKRT
jgi:hypothetical protein